MSFVSEVLENGREESFLFVVDSARRDRAAYPSPSNYKVPFNSPFKNFVGLELLDATIPRTQYLVPRGSNRLDYTTTTDGKLHSVEVAPGDYTMLQLAEALGGALARVADGGGLEIAPASAPAELTNRFVFRAPAGFTLHASTSTLAAALGLGCGGNDLRGGFVSGGLGPATVVAAELPETVGYSATGAGAHRDFVATASGDPTEARVYCSSGPGGSFDVLVLDVDSSLEVARGSWAAPPDAVAGGMDLAVVAMVAAAPLVAGRSYRLSVADASGDVRIAVDPSAAARACAELDVLRDGYVAECPDLVNLTGEPYVLVRCPNIEQLLFRDRANEAVHGGMGMVKMGNYGFREQRFDFVSFPQRRLKIPLTALPQLEIRLERGDGTLYDAQGVDHHMVMVVTYITLQHKPAAGPVGAAAMVSPSNPQVITNEHTFMQRHGYKLARPR
jgi:hypothetical protein